MEEEVSGVATREVPEVKPAFTARYISLMVLVAIVPLAIGALGNAAWNAFFSDKKVIEVASESSGNLASISEQVSNNIQIYLGVNGTQKELIKHLIRYTATVSNRSEVGADTFVVILSPPKNVELVEPPEITTNPPELLRAITIRQSTGQDSDRLISINLLNPDQSIKIAYLGFSRVESVDDSQPLAVVIQKRDWKQSNIAGSGSDSFKLYKFFDVKIVDWTTAQFIVVVLLSSAPIIAFFVYVQLLRAIFDLLHSRWLRREGQRRRSEGKPT